MPSDEATDVFCDDLAIIHLQYSTQWDALCHVGSLFDADGDGVAEPVYYNGFRAGVEIVGPQEAAAAGIPRQPPEGSTSRAAALGIETIAAHGVQGRAVMIDLRAHLGDDRTLVGHDTLMGILERDEIEVEPGDMVCLHTGFADIVLGMHGKPDPDRLHNSASALDGRDRRLLDWISDSGLAALIADNYAVEALPPHRRKRADAPSCPCTSTACSRTASRLVNSGT
ncbi:cyclase family protein [Fodinicurvata halophila]|uniref:cyclase family protein n=1 Tax=Fodinicurvata halophila TaxID=1419723 RepID=UPI00362E0FB0